MLSHKDKEILLSEFPKIKLSYENIIHKKVYNIDLIVGIPEGIKCFAWFTIYNEKSLCLIMELSKNKMEINDIKIGICCFNERLCFGTLFYGTLFNYMNNKFFSIEDIFYNKGNNCFSENWENKFIIISEILNNDIKQLSYNNNFIIFGLPIISNSDETFNEIINKNIKYKISSVQYRSLNRVNNYLLLSYDEYEKYVNKKPIYPKQEINMTQELNMSREKKENKENKDFEYTNKNTKDKKHLLIKENLLIKEQIDINKTKNVYDKQNIFIVKPDIQNDVYHLYINDSYKGLACIPDYKTSVMLNELFRNIKENKNLDALEESDEEDEFENCNIDKFVFLDKSHKMLCNYNKKFKKWVPIRVVD
jgi:hypothetical protein